MPDPFEPKPIAEDPHLSALLREPVRLGKVEARRVETALAKAGHPVKILGVLPKGDG